MSSIELCGCSSVIFVNLISEMSWVSWNTSGMVEYHNDPKFSDTRKLCYNLPRIQTKRQSLRVFCQKDVNGKANSEDPDQTVPLGAVSSGSALFAQTYPSENLCPLW